MSAMQLKTQSGARSLARWALALTAQDTVALRDTLAIRLVDYLANLIGGSTAPSVEQILRVVPSSDAGPVPLADGARAGAEWATLPYGAAAHALEFDDTHQPSSSHPGAVVFSAVLPLAFELASSWDDVAVATTAGYEVMCRIAAASGPANEYDRAFHPTGTCGVFGAATAAAILLDADEDQLVDALGIATSFSSGSMGFLTNGAWTKHLHPGWAGHAGIFAARLAVGGFRGPDPALEGPFGYLVGHSGAPDVEQLTAGLGSSPLALVATSIKAHGCCRYEQGALDAILTLRAEHHIQPDDVESVDVAVLGAGWDIIAEPREEKRRPRSPVDAQFSMPFGAAVALLLGRASAAEHTQDKVDDPAVQALMDRVRCHRDADLDAMFPRRWPATVSITLRDGRRVEHSVTSPKGDPENPFTYGDIAEKFRELAASVPEDRQTAVLDAVDDLSSRGHLLELAAALEEAWSATTTAPQTPTRKAG